jgi:stage II sporulation protein D
MRNGVSGNRLYFLIPAIFLLAGCTAELLPAESFLAPKTADIKVRIAVLKGADHALVHVRGPYRILDAETRTELASGRDLAPATVRPEADGIRVGGRLYRVHALRIVPETYVDLYTGQKERRYRGTLEVSSAEGKLLFVNTLGLENYIRGVLYHEVSHRWPLEAIKAQAVAARSYALYQVEHSRTNAYDMTNDIYSQVYGGRNSERYRTNIAVERTRGEILVFHGKVLPAYYHATCGGHTENAKELWNIDLYPLRGVVCRFCRHSPHYSWKINLRLKDIQDALNAKGYKIDLIKDIVVTDRTPTDRVRTLKIVSRTGKTLTMKGKDFREAVGPNVIRSNLYHVIMKGYYCDFIGRGWGHGVGLCQWGAMGMARERYDYRAILSYYYPGTEVVPDSVVDLPGAGDAAPAGPEKQ